MAKYRIYKQFVERAMNDSRYTTAICYLEKSKKILGNIVQY